jgi:hypothetical protein
VKIRGNITPEEGSVFPNQHAPWGREYDKVAEAESGITYMRRAKHRVGYEAGWTRFVDSIEEAWARFYAEGIQNHRKFRGWISKHNKTRQKDELLCYITQARHQSQHGIIALAWSPGSGISVGQGFAGAMSELKIYSDGSFEAEAQAAPSSPKPFAVYFDPGKATLPTVENKKFKQTFPPPTTHLGKSIAGIGPIEASEQTLLFYRAVFDAAKRELS